MQRTLLTAEVLTANHEHSLSIPRDTVRLDLTSSGWPVRVSFLTGEVAATIPKGQIIGANLRTIGRLGCFQGPLYFAAEQPHALIWVACWHGGGPSGFPGSPPGGAFDQSAFDSSFDIGP